MMLRTLKHLDRERFIPGIMLLRQGPLWEEAEIQGFETLPVTPHRLRQPFGVARAVFEIARWTCKRRIRLLHSNGFRAHLYGGLAARICGIPEFWTVHTHEQPGLLTELILSIPTTQALSNCPRTRDYFRSQGIQSELIWPGIDLDELHNRTPLETLCRQYNVPTGRRLVSMVARLQRYKGQEFFLRAVATAIRSHPDIHGVVVGGSLFGMESDYLTELRQLAHHLGLDDHITFTGFIPDQDVRGFIASSATLLHPALEEDFGLSVAEAQALGIPVVAFEAVGPGYIVLNHRTGLLVKVGDSEALGVALTRILGSDALPPNARSLAHENVRLSFDSKVLAAKVGKLYEAHIGSRP